MEIRQVKSSGLISRVVSEYAAATISGFRLPRRWKYDIPPKRRYHLANSTVSHASRPSCWRNVTKEKCTNSSLIFWVAFKGTKRQWKCNYSTYQYELQVTLNRLKWNYFQRFWRTVKNQTWHCITNCLRIGPLPTPIQRIITNSNNSPSPLYMRFTEFHVQIQRNPIDYIRIGVNQSPSGK